MIFFLGMMTTMFVKAQTFPFQGAKWITITYPEDTAKRVVPIFQTSVTLKRAVKKAELYITALGLYEASINGKRVGDAYFTPGFTNYNKRLAYQVYDVTKILKRRNMLSVLVGEGWYRGTFRNLVSDAQHNNYGKEAGLLAKLIVTYADGSRETKVTNENWSCAKSDIRFSEFYDGEFQDSDRRTSELYPVKIMERPKVALFRSVVPPVTKHERIVALTATKVNEKIIVDFGQNLAGWVRPTFNGLPGDSVIIEHAEILDGNGDVFLGNLRSAKATDTYILSGGEQMLEPHFTYHGFRYLRVSYYRKGSLIDLPKGNTMFAIALYSDLKKTGTFSCSDPLINKLQSNIEWSLKSNFLEIPTDCPQRSERLGWTADAQVFCATASFLRDTKSFYEKWLADLVLEQGSNGAVPNFIPTSSPYRENFNGVTGWGDAATIMPWTLYQVYGDRKILERHYTSMKGWVDYMTSASKDGLFQNKGYGDWYAMGQETDIKLIDQCFYAASTSLLIKAAQVLNKPEDVKTYEKLLDNIRTVFRQRFHFDTPGTATQTAYVLALNFNLLPEAQRKAAADSLVKLSKANGNKLATGFLGTPYLLPVLSRFGHSEVAYQLLMQQACPSWLYPVTKGATTIWERWDAVRPDGSIQETSFNHYAYGAVGQWLYENVAGIKATSPGYRTIAIEPEIRGPLQWAKATYRCPNGLISSSWKKQGGKVLVDLVIPVGTSAVFRLGATVKKLSSGTYHFRLPQ